MLVVSGDEAMTEADDKALSQAHRCHQRAKRAFFLLFDAEGYRGFHRNRADSTVCNTDRGNAALTLFGQRFVRGD